MKNEKLPWKANIPATCPVCGDRKHHRTYLNADTLFCTACDAEFRVRLYASNVEWKAVDEWDRPLTGGEG